MTDIGNWRSAGGDQNSTALRTQYFDGFKAISELDRLSHLALHRAGSRKSPASLEQVVGIALLRRSVTVFASYVSCLSSRLRTRRELSRARSLNCGSTIAHWLTAPLARFRSILLRSRSIAPAEQNTFFSPPSVEVC